MKHSFSFVLITLGFLASANYWGAQESEWAVTLWLITFFCVYVTALIIVDEDARDE